jgi:hypothetical protein
MRPPALLMTQTPYTVILAQNSDTTLVDQCHRIYSFSSPRLLFPKKQKDMSAMLSSCRIEPSHGRMWRSDVFRHKVGFIAPSLREGHRSIANYFLIISWWGGKGTNRGESDTYSWRGRCGVFCRCRDEGDSTEQVLQLESLLNERRPERSRLQLLCASKLHRGNEFT